MGCTSPIRTPYRETGNPPPLTSNPLHKLVASNGTNNLCVLSALEFDDMGVLLNRKALERTYAEIARLRETRPIMLVIYVHGWKHSAAPGDHNLASFVRLMTDLAASRMRNPSGLVYTPVGVYIGWRGNLADFEKGDLRKAVHQWQNIAYYNRDAAAKRVSGPTATEVLLSLAGMAKARSLDALETLLKDPEAFFQSEATNGSSTVSIPTDRYESRVVIAGHSMGGLIVENAVSQATLGHLAITRAQQESAQTFTRNQIGDLTQLRLDFRSAKTNLTAAEAELQRALGTRDTLSVKVKALEPQARLWSAVDADYKLKQSKVTDSIPDVQVALADLAQTTDQIATYLGISRRAPAGPAASDSPAQVIGAARDAMAKNTAIVDALELGHLAVVIATNTSLLETALTNVVATQADRAALKDKLSENVLRVRRFHEDYKGEAASLKPTGSFLDDSNPKSIDLLSATLEAFVADGSTGGLSVTVKDHQAYADRTRRGLTNALQQYGETGSRMPVAIRADDLLKVQQHAELAISAREKLSSVVATAAAQLKEFEHQEGKLAGAKLKALDLAKEVKAECASPTNTPPLVLNCANTTLTEINQLVVAAEANAVKARREFESSADQLRMFGSAEFIKTLFGNTLPADLILLINPASSALTASKMSEALNNPRVMATNVIPPALMNGNPFQLPGRQPLIINISSKADSATRAVFPLAHGIAAVNKRFIDSGQRQLFTHTARNVPRLVTHHLVLDQKSTASYRSRRRDLDQGLNAADRHERFLRMNLLATNGWVARDGQVNRLLGNRIIAPGERVYRLEENSANSSTGYWVVDCAEELLPGHNDFWTPEFYSTVAAMIRVRRLYDLTPRALQTNQGEQAEVPGSTQHTAE